MKTSAYAEMAESFLAKLWREEYLHLAGLKPNFETEEIFKKSESLFSKENVLERLDCQNDRSGRHLAEFAVHGYIEQRVRSLTEKIANEESHSEIEYLGQKIPFHSACRQLMIEPNHEKRHLLEETIAQAVILQNATRAKRVQGQREIAQELGFKDYLSLCEELSGQLLRKLGKEMELFLQETERDYETLVEASLNRAGLASAEATEADLRWLAVAPEFDDLFPSDRLLPSAEATLRDLGIELSQQPNVHLDLEPRPTKHPRPFCCPIKIPGEVWVVVSSRGGYFDYLAFFHELGHAEHFSHINPDLPMAFRLLGDKGICEGFAFTFQSLAAERSWLAKILDLKEIPEEIPAAVRLLDFSNARRCAAKLCFEIELHTGKNTIEELQKSYVQLLQRALLVKIRPRNFLFDLDDAFYCAVYLRAWLLDVCVREQLKKSFGEEWFFNAKAGEALKKFWAMGQEKNTQELAKEICPSFKGASVRDSLVKRLRV